jgi:UDP-glucuronate 4-epimerase
MMCLIRFTHETYLVKIKMKKALVTGSSGFIGFHISKKLLENGWEVFGIDDLNNYYDVNLKLYRQNALLKYNNFSVINDHIQTPNLLLDTFKSFKPHVVLHLAAQAGVRYSIENPRAYLESNIIGTFELLEAAKKHPPKHMLLASTSSAYGANKNMPYNENDKADKQVSFYAATKKSTENIAHSYSHLFDLPITMFRFFTVYGPLGRPDMAPYIFTNNILNSTPINVFNHGKMMRDFTYIDDLIQGLYLLISKPPYSPILKQNVKGDNLSDVAPFRVINIGNGKSENLMDFIRSIELATGCNAKIEFKDMQDGDVVSTWACNKLLIELTGYKPKTSINYGIKNYVEWFKSYYT